MCVGASVRMLASLTRHRGAPESFWQQPQGSMLQPISPCCAETDGLVSAYSTFRLPQATCWNHPAPAASASTLSICPAKLDPKHSIPQKSRMTFRLAQVLLLLCSWLSPAPLKLRSQRRICVSVNGRPGLVLPLEYPKMYNIILYYAISTYVILYFTILNSNML